MRYNDRIEVKIIDRGGKVPRSQIKSHPLDDLITSGLGVYLIENIFDYVNYNITQEDIGTELTLIKRTPGNS